MGTLTTYGQNSIFAVGMGAIDPPILYLALFSTSANPASVVTELGLSGYSRQAVTFGVTAPGQLTNVSDVVFGPLSVGSYLGVALIDSPTAGISQAWMWEDEAGPITIPAGSFVTFAAGNIDVNRV